MRRGEKPEELPTLETRECRVCNVNVKYLREHLKNVHKITEQVIITSFKALFSFFLPLEVLMKYLIIWALKEGWVSYFYCIFIELFYENYPVKV